jgi:hypothetical protein
VIAIGTLWTFSSRCWAVTTTSLMAVSRLAAGSAAYAAPPAPPKAIAATPLSRRSPSALRE